MGKGSGSQTTTQKTEVPSYVQDSQQNLLSAANRFTSPFLQNSPSSTVAGFTPDQEMAFDAARGLASNAFTSPYPSIGYMPPAQSWFQFAPVSQMSPANVGQAETINPAQAGSAVQATAADAGRAALANPGMPGPAALTNAASAGSAALLDPSLGQVSGDKIRALLNPYTQDVLDPTIARMRRELGETQAGIGARNASSAAFGGSRGALQSAEADRNFGDRVALTTGQLMAQGYDHATATALANAQSAQQAGQFNAGQQNQMGQFNAGLTQQAGLANMGALNQANQFSAGLEQQANLANASAQNDMSRYNAGLTQNVNLANAASANDLNKFNANIGLTAATANQNAQNALNAMNAGFGQQSGAANMGAANDMSRALYTQYNQALQGDANRPLAVAQLEDTLRNNQQRSQLSALQALLGTGGMQQQTAQQSLNQPADMLRLLMQATPNATGSTSSTTQPTQSNPLGFLSGLIGAGQGLFGSSGLFPGALAGLSDERDKTDIQKLGKDPKSGLDMYAYRYKADPRNTMKVVGPMAQDIEKKYPAAVREIGGHKVVDGSALRAVFGL